MRRLLTGARPHVITIAIVAVISVAGIATANQAIRNNTVNTRDIKDNQVNTRDLRNNSLTTRDIRDNQVNTRDLRDGALRGVDVHDGSLGLEKMSPAAIEYAGTASLLDPRAHDQDSDGNGAVDNPAGSVAGHACCISWSQGPTNVEQSTPSSADPIPNVGSGRQWRSVVLDPGSYVVESSGSAEEGGVATAGIASRLFLGGKPLRDGDGYTSYPAGAAAGLPPTVSRTTVIEVGEGSAVDRQLIQRVTSLEGEARFSDNLLIWEVTPR